MTMSEKGNLKNSWWKRRRKNFMHRILRKFFFSLKWDQAVKANFAMSLNFHQLRTQLHVKSRWYFWIKNSRKKREIYFLPLNFLKKIYPRNNQFERLFFGSLLWQQITSFIYKQRLKLIFLTFYSLGRSTKTMDKMQF